MTDDELAAQLASEAGELLLEIRRKAESQGDFDAKALKDEGDKRSHDFLMARLAELRPGDAILSEEGADNDARLSADRTWIVDPLDGTREFSEPPRTDWAVHVALWVRGELVAGAVALPAQRVTLSTDTPPVVPPAPVGPPRLVVSRTRPPKETNQVAEALGCELVPMGSAGAKAMAVVQGEADLYVHGGGQYEWDSAAPVAVARSAGLYTARLDGSPLVYNQMPPYLPDLIICRPELADAIIEAARA